MSLQGSIETFAIADVLRLLAATSKSGRLHVQGTARAGTIWVDSARILAAESPSTPIVSGPVDILFQLLRFERGSFRFELDKDPPEPGEPLDIESALAQAEDMVLEWRELERRIPAQDSWVSLTPSLAGDAVSLSAGEWRTLVAVAGGRTVADIGQALVLGELQAARALARLLDLELIDIASQPAVGPIPESSENGFGAPAEPPSLGQFNVGGAESPFGSPPEAAMSGGPAAPPPPPQNATAVAEVAEQPSTAGQPVNGASTGGAWPDTNGLSGLAPPPPVPPTPLTPPPSWAPAPSAVSGWAAPEYPTLAPAPEAASAAGTEGPFPGTTRPEAGLINLAQAPSGFATPPETDLDHGAQPVDAASAITPSSANPFSYPAPEDGQGPDPYSYPPPTAAPAAVDPSPPSAPPSSLSPPTVATGAWVTPTADPADGNGYPALAPPLPPAFSSSLPGGSASWTPAPTAADPMAPALADNGWIGSLTDAIERADDTADGQEQPGTTSAGQAQNGTSTIAAGSSATPGPSFGSAPPPSGLPPMPPAPRVTLGGATWGNGPVPPPPAPPAPSGGWATSASLFEGAPERLAPPPPPPPLMVGAPDGTLAGTHPGMIDVADPPAGGAHQYGVSVEDADDIDRQLFNLSPRAREAVKQSSGLYDSRDRG